MSVFQVPIPKPSNNKSTRHDIERDHDVEILEQNGDLVYVEDQETGDRDWQYRFNLD